MCIALAKMKNSGNIQTNLDNRMGLKGTGISKQCGNRIYKLEITCSTKLIIV